MICRINFVDYSNPNKNTYLSDKDQRIIEQLINLMASGGEGMGLPHQDERFPRGYEHKISSQGIVDIVLLETAPPGKPDELDLEALKEECRKLKASLEELPDDSRERRPLYERIKRIEHVINRNGLAEIILNGEFTSSPKPTVKLYMGNIKKNKNPDLARDATLAHELFHAWNYFCSECSPHTVEAIDEAIVEYETLCFLDRISKEENVVSDSWLRDYYHKVFKWQLDSVKDKQLSVGLLAAYGFGAYIFERDTQKELLRAYPPLSGKLSKIDPDVKKAVSMLTPFYHFDYEEFTYKCIVDALNKKLSNKSKIIIQTLLSTMRLPIPNPWANITINDTIADCDKPVIKALPDKVKMHIEIRTLPEPYHGDPEASVYLLNGNPMAGDNDLHYIGQPAYQKEIKDELMHINTDFLWLRKNETIVDANGIPYPGYAYWKKYTKELRAAKNNPSLFCIEAFPYHTKHSSDFSSVCNLPSDGYTNAMILHAIRNNKYIVLMRCAKYWMKRVPELIDYPRLITLNTNQRIYLTRNNMSKSLPTQQAWDNFIASL